MEDMIVDTSTVQELQLGESRMDYTFSEKDLRALIELVEAFPILYVKPAERKSLSKSLLTREKAWMIIGNRLNKPVAECEKKWRSMRDRFVKERRRLSDPKTAAEKPVWIHYNAISFLHQHVRPTPNRKSGTSVSNDQDDEDTLSSKEGTPQSHAPLTPPADITSPPPSKRRLSQSSNRLPHSETIRESRASRSQQHPPPNYPIPPPPQYMNQNTPSIQPQLPFPCYPPSPYMSTLWNNAMKQMVSATQNSIIPPQISAMSRELQSNGQTKHNPMSPSPNTPRMEQQSNQLMQAPHRTRLSAQENEININVHVKQHEIGTANTNLSEYHYCMALAEMMEKVHNSKRTELKMKLINCVMEAASDEPPVFTKAKSTQTELDSSLFVLDVAQIRQQTEERVTRRPTTNGEHNYHTTPKH